MAAGEKTERHVIPLQNKKNTDTIVITKKSARSAISERPLFNNFIEWWFIHGSFTGHVPAAGILWQASSATGHPHPRNPRLTGITSSSRYSIPRPVRLPLSAGGSRKLLKRFSSRKKRKDASTSIPGLSKPMSKNSGLPALPLPSLSRTKGLR